MKVLVTGATGFIGNYVIEKLFKDGISIIATSTDSAKAIGFSWFNKVTYIPYEIKGKDEKNLFDYFEKPDKIIHLAWKGLPNYNQLFHIEENLWNDYFFLKNIIENGCKDVTITGTCLEYGLIEGELHEEMPTNPSNSYAVAKDSLRKFLIELQKQKDYNLKWVRLFYMYGKGQSESSLISQLEKAIENGETNFNMSRGQQIRDYLKVEKVGENLVEIAMQNEVTGIINNCSAKPQKLVNFVNEFLKQKNSKIKLNLGFYPYSSLEPMEFWGNNNKLKYIYASRNCKI